MRTQQRYLGLLPSQPTPTGQDAPLPAFLTFSEGARITLERHLSASGRHRGGPLYGERDGERLHVILASSGGYPWWYADFEESLLTPDERYMLGWNDCVTALYDGRVDWIGNWMAYPNSTLGDARADLAWLDLGYEHGLFDERHVLVVIGYHNDRPMARTYTSVQGEWITIGTEL